MTFKENASAANAYIGATKTHDGGAKAANDSEPLAKKPRQSVRKHQDPFLFYSDQETRMNELLLNDDNENDEGVIRESIARKTRISFELHPSLLLEDLLPVDFSEELTVFGDTSGDAMIDELRRLFFSVPDN
eukprot:scaffold1418_cov92-Skeletonema_dohrnii-CCMP3373.AAC.8